MVTEGKPAVLVVGAGGHARVCIEALADSGYLVVGCVSGDGAGSPGLPCPVVGRDDDLVAVAAELAVHHVFVAIGDNVAREVAFARAGVAGLTSVNAISRHAMVSPGARLGLGVAVLAGAVVNTSADIGDGVILNTRCSVDHDSSVGPFAHVAVGAGVAGGVRIGARALIGVGASLIPLVQVGADAIVGAGAAVIGDVAESTTVVGVPARPLTR
jgi:UDP-perosamine 4-acetyltransferase